MIVSWGFCKARLRPWWEENSCPKSGGQARPPSRMLGELAFSRFKLDGNKTSCSGRVSKRRGFSELFSFRTWFVWKNTWRHQSKRWMLGAFFGSLIGCVEALGLKVKTGVKVLEIQSGEGGLQGVKIEQEGAEDSPRIGRAQRKHCDGRPSRNFREWSSTQNRCFSIAGWSYFQTYPGQKKW